MAPVALATASGRLSLSILNQPTLCFVVYWTMTVENMVASPPKGTYPRTLITGHGFQLLMKFLMASRFHRVIKGSGGDSCWT